MPAQLGWPGLEAQATRGATRGWMGQVLLSGFQVLSRLAKDPAVDLAAMALTKHVDGAVDAGVYRLSADTLTALKGSGRKLDAVPAASDGGPLLVLIHGTFSDTPGTFGKLWTLHNPVVRQLFAHYGDRVYGLDHPTLGTSPIGNALMLVRALPAGARLHLLTHSRGGLVAEILARACGGIALDAAALALFADPRHAQDKSDLQALVKEARARRLQVERVVRVACPARGTLLASKRLDAYLSILTWCLQLASIPVLPQLVDFLHEVARRRADPSELPGLAAMMPGSPLVDMAEQRQRADSRRAARRRRRRAGRLDRLLGQDAARRRVLLDRQRLRGADALDVRRRAARVRGGRGNASFLLDRGGKVSHFNYFSNERTVDAIASALGEDPPADFAPIGPLSWAGEDASGTRAARAVARSRGAGARRSAARPAVFVLPGILGSNLARRRQAHLARLSLRQRPGSLAWNPGRRRTSPPTGRSAWSTTT